MKFLFCFHVAVYLLPLAFLAPASLAWCSLGDNSIAIQSDQLQMHGTVRVVTTGRYSMHEIRTPSGGTIREYVSPGGTVFAVGWDGPGVPDLKQILGSYFDTMKQTAAQRRGHGPLVIDTPEFYFVQSGHMRSFHGTARLPQQLPQGVSAADIK